jgi:uncharacterized protein YndB with AHSA1/START domain
MNGMSKGAERVTLQVKRHFEASAERVFDAWLDPTRVGKWLFATKAGEVARVEIDARVGGSFVIVDRRDGVDVEHVGTYLEIDRPKWLVFTFAVPRYSELSTRVCVEIEPAGAGCELTLTHEGVLPEYGKQTQSGWTMILDALAEVIS